ncbi:MAG: ABC transporter ATP-binding protein [Ferrimicrobium sp.]|jgi:branched-chain amino acid transport system ATP-binding protein|nr:ABC transporter ATP-binding protein [Ferrimicrobium sp.]
MAEPILVVDSLIKEFDGFRAVDGVSLSVMPGEIRAVIGPNGAGKSTLFSVIIGELHPNAGRVVLDGTDVTGLSTHKLMMRGLGCAFQATNVFWRLSVQECLEVAVTSRRRHSARLFGLFSRDVDDEVASLLDQVGLSGLARATARDLSHGDQRALEVALAVAMKPKVLLLDEPTAGMSPSETLRAVNLVRELVHANGLTVLIVEHDVSVVFSLADVVTVMHQGQTIAEGPPDEIRTNPTVVEVYLGTSEFSKGLS